MLFLLALILLYSPTCMLMMDVYVRLLAGAVLPLVSTVIKPNSNGFLEESLDRSLYRASQTPQVRYFIHLPTSSSLCFYGEQKLRLTYST